MLTAVEIYKKIAPKLGDEEATELITFIEESVQRGAATKSDLQEVARELETSLRNEIAGIETSLRNEIAELRGLLIKYILPIASLIGAVVGTILGIITR